MLSNIGFDGPSTVCTTGPITVRRIIGYIEWLPYLRQWYSIISFETKGSSVIDRDIRLSHLRQRVRRSHQLPPKLYGRPYGDGHQKAKGFFFIFYFFYVSWDFPPHLLCSGGAGCVVATWCDLRGVNLMLHSVWLSVFLLFFSFLCLAF